MASPSEPTSPLVQSKYKARITWPPDLQKLTREDAYRYERKYKRRVRFSHHRPRWNMMIGLCKVATITVLPAYMILYMDWGDIQTPQLVPVRAWFWKKYDSIWTTSAPERPTLSKTPSIPSISSLPAPRRLDDNSKSS